MQRNTPLMIAFCAIFMTFWAFIASAQNLEKEGLFELRTIWYNKNKQWPDSTRIAAVKELTDRYYDSNMDSLRLLGREIILYGQNKKDAHLIAYGWHQLARYFYDAGLSDSCILANKKALAGIKRADDVLGYSCYTNLALAFIYSDQRDSAIYYYKHTIGLSEQYGNNKQIAGLYINLATIYSTQGQYMEAINTYSKAKGKGLPMAEFLIATNIAKNFQDLGLNEEVEANYREAMAILPKIDQPQQLLRCYTALLDLVPNQTEGEELIRKADNLTEKLNQPRAVINYLYNAGYFFLRYEQIDRSKNYLDKLMVMLKNSDNESMKANAILDYARIYQLEGNIAQSLDHCRQVQAILERENKQDDLIDLYDLLYQNFETLNRPDSALFYLKKKEALTTLRNNQQSIKEIVSQYFKLKEEQEKAGLRLAKENAEMRSAAALARTRLMSWIFGLSMLSVLSIAAVYYHYYRQKKLTAEKLEQANRLLERKKQKLEQANGRLKRFSEVVSHDILSNLDLILSAGNVLVGSHAKKETLSQYYEMTHRTSNNLKYYCVNLLKEARTQKEEEAEEQKIDPMPVVKNVLSNLQVALEKARFKVELGKLSPSTLPQAIVEQAFQNLVSNVLRHGHTAPQPLLIITEEKTALGDVRWVVEDNGPGVPPAQREEIFKPAIPINGKGQHLGLSLLKDTLLEYDAIIQVENRPGGGARFVITLGRS